MASNRGNSSRRDDRDDKFEFNISTSPGVSRNLGAGDDEVKIRSRDVDQIRITFTSSEVGNGNPRDGSATAPQDGGLAVRIQAENAAGNLVGPVSRFDDEGITFKANRDALFDVRDSLTGLSRGLFDEVILGTAGADELGDDNDRRDDRDDDDDDDDRDDRDDRDDDDRDDDDDDDDAYYINGGAGNDRIFGGSQNDFLVGGTGNDVIRGRGGDDTASVNIFTDGADRVNLGEGLDRVVFSAAPAGTQIRLTFTSSEVGNGAARDSDTLANQDGRLAVRVQLEDSTGALIGPVSRYDDEGISFVRGAGQTFDVRDLVSGVSRGDVFDVVRLGTSGDDTISDAGRAIRYYDNGGAGNDTLIGGTLFDFLVGGSGNDRLDGRQGNDSLLGGTGADTFIFSGVTGNDRILDFVSGTDKIDFDAFGITAANVVATASGADTLLAVDSNNDGIADFQITLVGVGAPLPTDYIF